MRYSDRKEDAIKLFKDISVYNDSEKYWAVRDHENVWVVIFKDKEISNVITNFPPYGAAIVFIDEEDFEMVSDVKKLLEGLSNWVDVESE